MVEFGNPFLDKCRFITRDFLAQAPTQDTSVFAYWVEHQLTTDPEPPDCETSLVKQTLANLIYSVHALETSPNEQQALRHRQAVLRQVTLLHTTGWYPESAALQLAYQAVKNHQSI